MACEDGYVDILADLSKSNVQYQERDLLIMIVQELRIMNAHLSEITGAVVTQDDVDNGHEDYGM